MAERRPPQAPTPQQIQGILECYQAGRLAEAEALAKALTEEFPEDPFAWKALGAVLQLTGRVEEALEYLQAAVNLAPQDYESQTNLGIALQELGRLEDAAFSFEKVLVLNPEYAEGHNNLGVTLNAMGRSFEAEASYRRAIALEATYAEAYNNLGVVLQAQRRFEEAKAAHVTAKSLKPDYPEAHNNLGNTLKCLGRLREAETSYMRAIELNPGYGAALSNLCSVLKDMGSPNRAEAMGRRAIAVAPGLAEAHSNLATVLVEQGCSEEAENICRLATVLKPDLVDAHVNLGFILQVLSRLDESEASYRQAIALKFDSAEAHNNLLMLIGSMLFESARYHQNAANFARVVGGRVASRFDAWSCSRDQESLRIGFVSGDLRSHPVGFFLESLLMELQSSSMELFAYPTAEEADALTLRLKPLFNEWHTLAGLDDMEAARRIHGDRIDILIDLSGHTHRNRLPVFAWKPAPIQVSWLGYFASTGLSEMDYILGDPYVTPYEEAHHFVEKIWQLPETYLCFTPPDYYLPVSPLPAFSNGFVTFGCFNSLSRMTDEVVAVRAEILHAVPGSKLFLKDKHLDHEAGLNRVLSRFAALNIGEDRLILEGRSPREEYLACYNRVDIALSPFPYGGGTTSVEGLWMGVPVVTKKGNYFLSHLGESIAYNSGLLTWVAGDEEEYVAKAVAFASDLESLSSLREGMRERILNTPLFDAPRFARHFEQALRAMGSKFREAIG